MKRFISINYLLNNIKRSFKKYPLVIVFAFFATAISIVLVEYDNEIEHKSPFINSLLTFAIGIPLFFGISVLNTKSAYLNKYRFLPQTLGFLFLFLIYLSLPSFNDIHSTKTPYIRYGIFNLIVHLLVSYAPFLKAKELNGFWNYNKALFLRFCTALLYSVFIYVGLILALITIKYLFDIKINEKLYFEIYIVVLGIFNTWFFVSGVPDDINNLQKVTTYPKGLKTFTQYVLLPLLVVYLLILYVYSGNILISWNWPKGIVSFLISGVSILGFFNILLMYPYSKIKGGEGLQTFLKALYFILLPLVFILFMAIGMRVRDYGITINRYAIVLLGIWIVLVCLYFILKKDNIKFIPISLSIILLLASFGPWGMFSLSEKIQSQRLVSILENNHLIANGKIKNEVIWNLEKLPEFKSPQKFSNKNVLSDSLNNEVNSIIDYLGNYHGFSMIRPLFRQNIDSLITIADKEKRHFYKPKVYMESLGLKYIHKHQRNKKVKWFFFSYYSPKVINVKEYDYLVEFQFYSNKSKPIFFKADETNYTLDRQKHFLNFKFQDHNLKFSIKQVAKKLIKEYGQQNKTDIPKAKMIVLDTTIQLKSIKVVLQSIDLEHKDFLKVKNIKGYLLIKNNQKKYLKTQKEQ